MDTLSLLEQAREYDPAASDEDLIVGIARNLVDFLGCEPPVDPKMVASLQGIHRIEECELDWAGCLLNEEERTIIRVRSTDPRSRQRFTIFHEIAHTFLPGYSLQPQYRCTPGSRNAARDHNEQLCDLAASELLMPAEHMRRALAQSALDFGTVEELAQRFDASLEATARRVVSLWGRPALFVRFDLTTKPSDPHGTPKLRVASSIATGDWPFIPAYKSVSDDHVLYGCLSGQDIACITDLDDLSGRPIGKVALRARSYPYFDSEGVHHARILVIARRSPIRTGP